MLPLNVNPYISRRKGRWDLTTNQKVRVHYTKVGGDNVADKVTLIGN
jgi:hypothetical protein